LGAAIAVTLALVVSIALNVMFFMRRTPSASLNHSVRSTILSGIENVSELATIRESFQSIVTFEDGKKIPFINMKFPGTTKKFMLKYSGTIVCGCDLSKAQVSEPYAGDKIRITLPESEILDVYADIHSFEVYDQSAGIFTSVKLEDQNREVNSDLEKIKIHSVENGILAHADENVRKILTSVAASTGMQAEIFFTENKKPFLENHEILQLNAEHKNS